MLSMGSILGDLLVAAVSIHVQTLLGGSWVVISGAISKATVVVTHIRGLITILITTYEPPSTTNLALNLGLTKTMT